MINKDVCQKTKKINKMQQNKKRKTKIPDLNAYMKNTLVFLIL
jgi:hypothetical protein